MHDPAHAWQDVIDRVEHAVGAARIRVERAVGYEEAYVAGRGSMHMIPHLMHPVVDHLRG